MTGHDEDPFDHPSSAALWLAGQGFAVFPLDHPALDRCAGLHKKEAPCDGTRGKHPATAPTTSATADVPSVIARWAGTGARNVGVLCGPGLLVVDEDADGELARYCAVVGVEVPATFTVGTAKGRHYYFRVPDGLRFSNAEGALRDYGVNIRSGNGYVVGPGSVHASGVVYTPEDPDAPVATMPDWLCEALRPHGTASPPETLADYSGPLYGALSDAEQARIDRYTAAAVEGELSRLDECRAVRVDGWRSGDRRYSGPDWDTTVFEVGCQLAEVARSPWNGYTPARAEADFLARSPRDAGFTDGLVLEKWRHCQRHTAGQVRPHPEDRDPGLELDPDEFWSQRESLRAVHGWARARMASPWAVLGVALARVVTTVPPHVVLPATIGSHASLNLFVALVASSGGGKGAAMGAARDAVVTGGEVYTRQAGSGEGLVKQYARRTRDGVERLRDAVLFDIPEVDTLGALSSRQGSNLLPVMRSAWSGELLGFAYADPTKDIPLEAHTYRLCAVVGVQPERADGLFREADGGTPQRFLWLPATDPDIPDEDWPEPEPWQGASGLWWGPTFGGRHEVPMPAVAVQTIKAAHRARQRGDANALDGHALLSRAKVMVALALLDGRTVPTEEDWDLAGRVMEVSDRCRAGIEATLTKVAERASVSRGRQQGVQAAVAEDVQREETVKRTAPKVLVKIPTDWASYSDVRKGLGSAQRPIFEEVLERLAAVGQVAVEEVVYQGQPGKRVRRLV